MDSGYDPIQRGPPVDLLRSRDLSSPFNSPTTRSRTNSTNREEPPLFYKSSHASNTNFAGQPLIEIHSVSSRSTYQPQCVKWGVSWRTPTFIIFCALAGTTLAIGHHFYFKRLDGTPAGSTSRQQWAIRFGTAFSFLVITLLKTACDTAYNQYIWTLVKRKSFTFQALDKLFSMTTDPLGFLSWDLMKHAKLAYVVGIICWYGYLYFLWIFNHHLCQKTAIKFMIGQWLSRGLHRQLRYPLFHLYIPRHV
jgi:hypothetical protein